MRFAHCEYDNGFIIFNNANDGKEVWRRSSDCIGDQRPAESRPRILQEQAAEEAFRIHPSTTRRGHFEPWAYLEMPEETRAFRVVYPTLLVSGWNRAFLWDLPTASLRATVHDTQMHTGNGFHDVLGHITYVEVNDQYVIICGHLQLRVFSNRDQGSLLFHLADPKRLYARWSLGLLAESESPLERSSTKFMPRQLTLKDNGSDATSLRPQPALDYFSAGDPLNPTSSNHKLK